MEENEDNDNADSPPEPGSPRSFSVFLRSLDDAEPDLSDELFKLIAKLRAHAQDHTMAKGELVLKLKVQVDARDQVETTYDIKIKEPPKRTAKSVHWVDKSGNLSIDDPRQQKLNLRGVPKGKTRSLPENQAKAPRSI